MSHVLEPRSDSRLIKSVSESDKEILEGIAWLYLPEGEWFTADFTYSKGNIYKGLPQPKIKMDLFPQTNDTIQANIKDLPIKSRSIKSIICDLPFCFSVHGKTLENISAKRFGMFQTYQDFEDTYKGALREFHRILKPQSIVVVKCQDYSDSHFYQSHVWICNWAEEIGFKVKDLFVLVWTKGRIWNPNLKQRVSRKFHSYYWVFGKGGR